MLNQRHVVVLAAIALFMGILALALATNPVVALLGKLAIATSVIAFAAFATTCLMARSFAAHTRRNKDFHWT